MSNLGDVIKVIGNTEGVKWYSMLECTAQIENEDRRVFLPACFLKQIGVKYDGDDCIHAEDFMMVFGKYNKPTFNNCLPKSPKYFRDGTKRIEDFFETLLPKNYKRNVSAKSDNFYKKIYYVTRIASCSCVLSCSANKSIEGIEDICDNSPPDWQDYSLKFSAIPHDTQV